MKNNFIFWEKASEATNEAKINRWTWAATHIFTQLWKKWLSVKCSKNILTILKIDLFSFTLFRTWTKSHWSPRETLVLVKEDYRQVEQKIKYFWPPTTLLLFSRNKYFIALRKKVQYVFQRLQIFFTTLFFLFFFIFAGLPTISHPYSFLDSLLKQSSWISKQLLK